MKIMIGTNGKKEVKLLKFADKYCQKFNKKLTILGSEMDLNLK